MPRARDKFEQTLSELDATARDVLEAVERLPQLLQDEERLAAAIALMGAWIWEIDLQHRLTYLSENAGFVTGLAMSEMMGRMPTELGLSVAAPADQDRLCGLLEERTSFGPVDYLWYAPTGCLRLRVLGMPRIDRTGDVVGYRGIALQSKSPPGPNEPPQVSRAS